MRTHGWIVALALLVPLATCTDSTDVELTAIDASGAVVGVVYLDQDGSGSFNASDSPRPGVQVALTTGGGVEVDAAETDSAGAFFIEGVPAGVYELTVPVGELGDSLLLAGGAGPSVTIDRGDTVQVELGVSFPVVEIEDFDTLVVGRKVFTSGIALNSRLSFGDGRVHLRGEGSALRAVRVERAPVSIGDSIRLLGRTQLDGGRLVLSDVDATVLISQAEIPVPVELSTGAAAAAAGGLRDADLVRIRNGTISDTMTTVDGDFRFVVDDGTGPLTIVLQSFLQINTAPIIPDSVFRIQQAIGLLVPGTDPGGGTSWRLLPRSGGDVAIDVRQVDLGLSMTADRESASTGDTVAYTLVARNLGGIATTGVEVLDSLPGGLSLIDARVTRGAFDEDTGVWTVGAMPATASDTLELRAQVGTGVANPFIHRARFRPLSGALDTDPTNNQAAVSIGVGAGSQAAASQVIRWSEVRGGALPPDLASAWSPEPEPPRP